MTHDRATYDYWTTRGWRKPNRKLDGLQRFTQSVTECAWPNCDRSTPESFANERVGVLCLDHAYSHYDALNQFLVVDGTTQESLAADLRARRVNLDVITNEEFDGESDEDREAANWGWVYYLRVGDRIKIGFSIDVKRRLRSYPPGSELLAVEFGHKKLERQRHLEFAEWLAAGREWFDPSDQLMQHTRDLVDLHGNPGQYAHSYRELVKPQDAVQSMKYVRASKYR